MQAYGGNNTRGPVSVSSALSALSALSAHGGSGRMDFESETFIAHTLRGDGFDASEDGTGRGTPLVPVANSLNGNSGRMQIEATYLPSIAFGWQNSASQSASASAEITPTLDKSKTPGLLHGAAVRRLTPTECERLQGFPDGYTQVPFRGKPAADGPRYKALGNSWAVNCARWIGRRIEIVEQIHAARKDAA
jgi:DNA (cytosine-5)-methyltransferase 1